MGELLRMEHISKRFGDFYANKDISLTVNRGEVLTLLGENGAGKSTLMNILIGLYQPTEGKIFLEGKEVRIESPSQAVKLGIGMVHQHFMLVEAMTVFDNIILGDKHAKGLFIDRAARRKEIEELSSLSISSFDTMQLDYYPNTVDKALGESVRSYMARVLADLRDYAADFSPATRESLLLVGNAGLGKTHAALAIAGEVLRQNYDVIYVSCPDFFGKLEALHFGTDPGGEEETLFQIACNADLLILDDLGTEFNSSFFLTNLYSLLNNRLGAKLPTIVTTNITDGALLEKLYTEKISSRLAAFVQIQFLGSDIRVQKAAE